MIRYLINVALDSILTSIILGFFYGYFKKNEKIKEYRFYLLIGAVLTIIIAIIDQNSQIIKREYLSILLLILVLITQLILFIHFKDTILSRISICILICSLMIYSFVNILIMPNNFLSDGSSFFSTDLLFRALGYFIGILTSYLLFISTSYITLYKKNIRVYFYIIFIPLFFQNLFLLLKPLMARRIVPMYRWLFKTLVFILNNSELFILLALIILIIMALSLILSTLSERLVYKNPAQKRKQLAFLRRERRWAYSFLIFALISIFILTFLNSYSQREVELSPSEEFILEDNEIRIDLAQVDDGLLHRFTYKSKNSINVRFIVVQKSLSSYGLGLDACEICGPTGYYQRRDGIVCKRCDVVMNTNTIGFKGGCNPIPFDYKIEDGFIKIKTQTLDELRNWFK